MVICIINTVLYIYPPLWIKKKNLRNLEIDNKHYNALSTKVIQLVSQDF